METIMEEKTEELTNLFKGFDPAKGIEIEEQVVKELEQREFEETVSLLQRRIQQQAELIALHEVIELRQLQTINRLEAELKEVTKSFADFKQIDAESFVRTERLDRLEKNLLEIVPLDLAKELLEDACKWIPNKDFTTFLNSTLDDNFKFNGETYI